MAAASTIVVGIDFTPGCQAALAEALRMARWARAVVHPVHVVDTVVAADLADALAPLPTDIRNSLVANAERQWAVFAQTINGATDLRLDVRVNNRTAGILGAAREAGADLIVLGARGIGKPDLGPGSVATGCVRRASGRVLLVKDTQVGPFRTVVACIDFSPTSRLALEEAARIAEQDSAALHVLHVYRAPWNELKFHTATLDGDERFHQQYRDAVQKRLAEFARDLGPEFEYLKPTITLIDHDGHRSGIVDYAKRVHADLLVLGTRGRTRLRDVFLGSTAERALRSSPCSVLAVHPKVEAAASTAAHGEAGADEAPCIPVMQMYPPA